MGEKHNERNNDILSLYCDAKEDYRNALNLEQNIMNFTVSVIALCSVASSFMKTKTTIFVLLVIVMPVMISLAKILYIHQKHRSKTIKAYLYYLESKYPGQLVQGYEIWKKEHVDKFVIDRIGFKFAYIAFFVLLPYGSAIIGVLTVHTISRIYYFMAAVAILITIVCDLTSYKYTIAISNLEKTINEKTCNHK